MVLIIKVDGLKEEGNKVVIETLQHELKAMLYGTFGPGQEERVGSMEFEVMRIS